jgi:cytochrome c peroxidase
LGRLRQIFPFDLSFNFSALRLGVELGGKFAEGALSKSKIASKPEDLEMRKYLILLLLVSLSLFACRKQEANKLLEVPQPAHFPIAKYDLTKNPVTEQGFALGKKLFYDARLSRDSTISCGSCHIPYSAFTQTDHPTSHGIDNLFGRRNAPAVQNMAWSSTFFWDGGVPNLDLVPLNALENPVEMDISTAEVLRRLNADPNYRQLFKAAFPESDTIASAQLLQALSQFMVMLVSADSRYDRHILGKSGANLTTDELAGLQAFEQKCASCHSGALFTDQNFRNNGLSSDFTLDKGRYEVSQLPDDIGKFKVPSLRNVALTFPYMHHGRMATLEAVLDHYASGVKDSPSLDPRLKTGNQLGIALTAQEKIQIVAFLKTLSDDAFVRDIRFAE